LWPPAPAVPAQLLCAQTDVVCQEVRTCSHGACAPGISNGRRRCLVSRTCHLPGGEGENRILRLQVQVGGLACAPPSTSVPPAPSNRPASVQHCPQAGRARGAGGAVLPERSAARGECSTSSCSSSSVRVGQPVGSCGSPGSGWGRKRLVRCDSGSCGCHGDVDTAAAAAQQEQHYQRPVLPGADKHPRHGGWQWQWQWQWQRCGGNRAAGAAAVAVTPTQPAVRRQHGRLSGWAVCIPWDGQDGPCMQPGTTRHDDDADATGRVAAAAAAAA
jgi:hypothetical protein